MLIRDICFRGRDDLIDQVNIVFVPVFNVDGHERSTPYNRPNQRGPPAQGWRNTAQNLNLNRDYMKVDAPEMRAMLGLIGNTIPISTSTSTSPTAWTTSTTSPTASMAGTGSMPTARRSGTGSTTSIARSRCGAEGQRPHSRAADLRARRERSVEGPDLGAFSPRFSHGYGDLRRLPTVLVENHSLKPYRQRVLGTYVLLEATLKALASRRQEAQGGDRGRSRAAARRGRRQLEGRRPSRSERSIS